MFKKLLSGLLCTTFAFSSCIANMGNVFAEEVTYQNGDVNCDGRINSTDCAIILQKVLDSSYIMPIENVTTDYIAIADMDGDGVLTASDAAIVMQKILNNGSSTPSEDTTEAPTEPTTEPTTEAPTEPTTENRYLDFNDFQLGEYESPYTINGYAITNINNENIEVVEIPIDNNGNYTKAVDNNNNIIDFTINETSELHISGLTNIYGSYQLIIGTLSNGESYSNKRWVEPYGGDDVGYYNASTMFILEPGTYTLNCYGIMIESLNIKKLSSPIESTTETTTDLTISYDPDKGVYMENEIDYVNMPGVLKNEITFSDTENGELSPYVKDAVTLTAVSEKIETADINIYNYNKAVLLNGTLTVNIPENIHHIKIIGRVSPDASEGAVYDNSGYVSIPLSDTDFTMVNKVGKGNFTISGFDVYIAAIKLYGDDNSNISTETTTETSTEATTNDAIELDFSDIENGTYTTDISKDIFSIMAGDGSYSVEGEDVSKYIKLNPSDIDSDNSEGYILIDGSNMTDGFSLNIEGFIDGQSYCILSLINESGDVEDQIYENWGFERSNITLNANSAGKYILKVSCLPLRIYKLSISSKLQA